MAQLGTKNTLISKVADEHTPRLVALKLPDAMPWAYRDVRLLPEKIVVRGASQSVNGHWDQSRLEI